MSSFGSGFGATTPVLFGTTTSVLFGTTSTSLFSQQTKPFVPSVEPASNTPAQSVDNDSNSADNTGDSQSDETQMKVCVFL